MRPSIAGHDFSHHLLHAGAWSKAERSHLRSIQQVGAVIGGTVGNMLKSACFLHCRGNDAGYLPDAEGLSPGDIVGRVGCSLLNDQSDCPDKIGNGKECAPLVPVAFQLKRSSALRQFDEAGDEFFFVLARTDHVAGAQHGDVKPCVSGVPDLAFCIGL